MLLLKTLTFFLKNWLKTSYWWWIRCWKFSADTWRRFWAIEKIRGGGGRKMLPVVRVLRAREATDWRLFEIMSGRHTSIAFRQVSWNERLRQSACNGGPLSLTGSKPQWSFCQRLAMNPWRCNTVDHFGSSKERDGPQSRDKYPYRTGHPASEAPSRQLNCNRYGGPNGACTNTAK